MASKAGIAACLAVASLFALFAAPVCAKEVSFLEKFDAGWKGRWTHSGKDKYSGRFVVEAPEGSTDEALKVPEKAKHYGISTKLDHPVDPAKGLVLQYEVKLSEGLTCGGAYLKFVKASDDFDPESLEEATPYSIMFGPDKCGGTNKVHLILKHTSPSGDVEEKHLQTPPLVETDKLSHVYTVVLKPDNTYAVLIDGVEKKAGSILEDFEPAINPPEEIDDPEDKKPEDWVDTPKIADPDATKPDDWDEDAPREIEDEESEKPEGWLDDEPQEVDDPEAEQPEDWDEEEDGEWEAPKVPNPACKVGCGEWKRPTKINPNYKGKWHAPMIDNPDYKGPWSPKKIPNPKYFVDETPLKNIGKIGGVAVEIWTMDDGYFFDNILVSDDPAIAEQHRDELWKPKFVAEEAAAEAEKAKAKENEDDEDDDEDEDDEDEATPKAKPFRLGKTIAKLFDHQLLAPVKPHLKPLLDALKRNEPLAYSLTVAPLLMILLPFLMKALSDKPKKASARMQTGGRASAAKKQDVTGADDKPEGKKATATVTTTTVVEEEEEDEGAAVRRRTVRRE
ncbi:hypothetical protein WJX72_004772 [[Myrmecia] bisecta]|uniref:Calnexin n=1 Tax=[Myrmecia] bisecta TaxID=41462 RepID=A0AAW1PSR0_9CHLO